MDHFLDELVGCLQVVWVGTVQQARQHLSEHPSEDSSRQNRTCAKSVLLQQVSTLDFSSSSKMSFLGLGGGSWSSLSAGSSGSSLMMPGSTHIQQVSISYQNCVSFPKILSHLVSSASDRHRRSWPPQAALRSSCRSAPEPFSSLALGTVHRGTW